MLLGPAFECSHREGMPFSLSWVMAVPQEASVSCCCFTIPVFLQPIIFRWSPHSWESLYFFLGVLIQPFRHFPWLRKLFH